ncbi:MAG: ATP-grasp domain-containing protein [Methanobacteriota archaeon]
MERILVCGLNCRPVALSAKALGFEVCVVDFFGDVDLKRNVDKLYSLGGEYDSQKLCGLAVSVAEKGSFDGVFLTSELGCNASYVKAFEPYCTILGNDLKTVAAVRDWKNFFKKLSELDIPHPKTRVVSSEGEVAGVVAEIGFPLVVKPTHGSAGFGVILAETESEVYDSLKHYGVILVQEYIKGVDASVSALGSGKAVKPLSFNRQFLGIEFLGCTLPFQYCGNMVPVKHGLASECKRITELIGSQFNLKGSFGIDFVIADKPYVIEVNPRFQDTLECVERVYGINLVEQHLNSLEGRLPNNMEASKVCAKGILYADSDLTVSGDLTKISEVVDLYKPGTKVSKGEPVCSAFGVGARADEALNNLKIKVGEIQKNLLKVNQ